MWYSEKIVINPSIPWKIHGNCGAMLLLTLRLVKLWHVPQVRTPPLSHLIASYTHLIPSCLLNSSSSFKEKKNQTNKQITLKLERQFKPPLSRQGVEKRDREIPWKVSCAPLQSLVLLFQFCQMWEESWPPALPAVTSSHRVRPSCGSQALQVLALFPLEKWKEHLCPQSHSVNPEELAKPCSCLDDNG